MTSQSAFPRRGDVYWVDFEPILGSEIGKLRPALVVSNDLGNEHSATVTVVPISTHRGGRVYPFEALLPGGAGGLAAESRAKCNQIRAVDKRRVRSRLGTLPSRYVVSVEQALRHQLALA